RAGALSVPRVARRILETRSLAALRDVRAIILIARSGLFDRAWYLASNPDVADAGVDPLYHYVMFGVHEGREPSPSFDTRDYLANNVEAAVAGTNRFAHHVRPGARAGSHGEPPASTGAACVGGSAARQGLRSEDVKNETGCRGSRGGTEKL